MNVRVIGIEPISALSQFPQPVPGKQDVVSEVPATVIAISEQARNFQGRAPQDAIVFSSAVAATPPALPQTPKATAPMLNERYISRQVLSPSGPAALSSATLSRKRALMLLG